MNATIREQTIEQVDRLDETQRQLLLDFARRLTAPEGTAGRDLLRFAGAIDRADLELLRFANYSDRIYVAALSSAPKTAGGDTGATAAPVTIICEPQ